MSSTKLTDDKEKRRASTETVFKTLTALFGLATALLSLFAGYQNNQKQQAQSQSSELQQQIESQNQKISTLEQQLNTQTTTTTGPIEGPTSEPLYLSDIRTVDTGGYNIWSPGDVAMNGTIYRHSGQTRCGPTPPPSYYVEWNVAGHDRLTVVFGIDDNARNASDATAEITLTDQNRRPVDGAPNPIKVSIGSPERISVPLQGITRLRMECVTRDKINSARNRNFNVALGTAQLSA